MSALHEELIVIDGLIVSNWSADVFRDMRKGGLTAANCTCCVWEGFVRDHEQRCPMERLVPRA